MNEYAQFYISFFKSLRVEGVTQRVKELATQLNYPSSIPRTHIKERITDCPLTYLLEAVVYPPTHSRIKFKM